MGTAVLYSSAKDLLQTKHFPCASSATQLSPGLESPSALLVQSKGEGTLKGCGTLKDKGILQAGELLKKAALGAVPSIT